MSYELYRGVTGTGFYGLPTTLDERSGTLVGSFETDDGAMAAAQDAGLLRPAADEEGGPPFAVLCDTAMIVFR